jgi:hypothetical protein
MSFTPDDTDAIMQIVAPVLESTLSRAVQEAGVSTSTTTWRPGTVQGTDVLSTRVDVIVDGDTEAISAGVIGQMPTEGSRVMVVFVPPSAVFAFAMAFTEAGTLVGYDTITANTGAIGNLVDLGLEVSFVATGGRRYKITAQIYSGVQVGAGDTELRLRDGAGGTIDSVIVCRSAVTVPYPITLIALHAPPAGSYTYKLTNITTATSFNYFAAATAIGKLLVEDAGPI